MKKLMYGFVLAFALTAGANAADAQTTTKSRAGKNAVIGAAAGAATGAAVSKKRGKGAIIGGAVGAGAGYLYGRHKDKKNPTRKTVYKTTVK